MMADQWYYGSDGKQQGPVSFEQLQQLAASGQVDESFLVWKEGMAEWTSAAKIESLIPATQASGEGEWHYSSNGQQQGPVAFERLHQLASSGELTPNDLVWKEGMAEWTTASKIDGLSFTQPAPAAPAGPPSMPEAVSGAKDGAISIRSLIADIDRALPKSRHPVLIFVGLAFLFLAFFTPWWSITFYKPDVDEMKEYADAVKDTLEFFADNKDWYKAKFLYKEISKFGPSTFEDDEIFSVSLWGWSTGTGLMGFIFVFVLTPLILAMMFVKLLQPWSWIADFMAALIGLLMLIMFLSWFFGAPSKDTMPVMSQGLNFGPYLVMFGGFLMLGGGILGLRQLQIDGIRAKLKSLYPKIKT